MAGKWEGVKTMQAIYRHLVEPLHFPVDGYLYIVRTETSIDGGQTFYYAGNSKYFRTEAEANAFAEERRKESNGTAV